MKQKILITGSEGLLGKITSKTLEEEGYELVLIDKKSKNPLDILKDNISDSFKGIETVIHFAANPRPWINETKSKENIDMTWNILESCRKNNIKRLIYTSSINVYDMKNLFGKQQINSETLLHPNTKIDWKEQKGGLFYPISKIVSESITKSYHQAFGIDVLNLRLGCVTPHNRPYTNEPEDYAVWLSQEDFKEIIKKSINFKGFNNLICTSNNSEKFVNLNPLKEVLGYIPKSNSIKYEK